MDQCEVKGHDGKISRMEESSVQEAKRALRTAARKRREHGFDCKDAHSHQIIDLVRQRGYKTIAAFVEFDNEPDLSLLRRWCSENGVDVLLPEILDDSSLTWHCGSKSRSLSEAELIVIPALAAGRDGSRLGRGKGYYDRALAGTSGLRLATVHDEEVFDAVPIDSNDQKVSLLVSCSNLFEASAT